MSEFPEFIYVTLEEDSHVRRSGEKWLNAHKTITAISEDHDGEIVAQYQLVAKKKLRVQKEWRS